MEPKEKKQLKPITIILEPEEVPFFHMMLDSTLKAGGMNVIDKVFGLRKKVQEALNEQK